MRDSSIENLQLVSDQPSIKGEVPVHNDIGVTSIEKVLTEPMPLPVDTRNNSSKFQRILEDETKHDLFKIDSPGLFDRPRIFELRCVHDIRIPKGRTLVMLSWGGWGSVNAQAEHGSKVFQKRLNYGWPRQREINFLVPVGAMLKVTVSNAWGDHNESLEILKSEPPLSMLVIPPLPDIIGVRMPAAKLPFFPSAAFVGNIPKLPKFVVSTRRFIPSIDGRLFNAITLLSRQLKDLPAWFGSGQKYQRERLSPIYGSLRVGNISIMPVRDKLKVWLLEIHQGDDDTETG